MEDSPHIPPATATDPAEQYLVLLNQHERSLAAYVHALVPDRLDAEDILQSCKLTMWKQFANFEPGSHFLAWARKIAFHQILNHRRGAKRKPRYSAEPAFLEAVAAEIDRVSDTLADRSEALHECLKRLPENQRRLVLLRYYEDHDIAAIAKETDRTEAAVYKLLSRLRAALNDCVKARLDTSPA
jgi:RNA polymerase sigma-70 factor (ECF subfamily)